MRQDGKRGGKDSKSSGQTTPSDTSEVDFDLTQEAQSLEDAVLDLGDLEPSDDTLGDTTVAFTPPGMGGDVQTGSEDTLHLDVTDTDASGDEFFLFGEEPETTGDKAPGFEPTVAGTKHMAGDALESTAAFGEATLPFGMESDDDRDDVLGSTVALPSRVLPDQARPSATSAAQAPDLTPLDLDLGVPEQGAAAVQQAGQTALGAVAAATAGAAASRIAVAMERAGSAEVHPQHVLEPEATPVHSAGSRTEPSTDPNLQKMRIRVPLKAKPEAAEPEPEPAARAMPEFEEDEGEAEGLQPHWPRIIGLGAGALLLLWLLSSLFRSGDEPVPSPEPPVPPTAESQSTTPESSTAATSHPRVQRA